MLRKSISLFLVFVMVVIPIIVNAQAKVSDVGNGVRLKTEISA